MFSSGQKLFALFFLIAFAAIMVWSYRKDIKLHKIYYKKVWMVAVGIAIVIAGFALISYYLHD